MEKIYVDDAMKQRILQNIEQEPKEQRTTQNIEQEPKEQRIPQNIEQEPKEQRILQNIEQEQNKYFTDKNGKKHIFHYFQYKKLSVCAAVVVLLLCCVFYFGTSTILQPDTANQHNLASANKKDSLSARADRKEADSDDVSSDAANAEDEFNTGEESDAGSEFMDMLPDMNQYSSAKELSRKIGFTISDIPSSLIPFKISERTYSDYGDGLAEIQYYNDKADNVIYHKQTAANADVSGDYTEYSKITTIRVRSTNICLKGENDKYNLATWSKGNYSYSLYFSEAITEKAFQNILKITI